MDKKALISLYNGAENYFLQAISSKYLALDCEAIAYMTDVPAAELNFVYIHNNIDNLNKILIESYKFFGKNKLPFIVIVPEHLCKLQVENTFKTMGFSQTESSISMALKLSTQIFNSSVQLPQDLAIHANNSQLNQWMMPLVDAFESTFEISSQYAKTHKKALKKKFELNHFSLYKQGQPIASITLSQHNTIARIDDVGTLPAFQRKGYATSLINYALFEAKKRGGTYCFLEASNSALSIYQKLGFESLFKNVIYSSC